jgi:23S rRNA (guanosine2251-2'-O)-methyltransferase
LYWTMFEACTMWAQLFAQLMLSELRKFISPALQARPPHREIQKSALGATESMAWEYAENPAAAVQKLKALGYQIVIIEQTTESISLHEFTPKPEMKYCLVFGNEVDGVSEEVIALGDIALEIPQSGTKHSLNISVCLGIVVWEMHQKIKLVTH